ncbi:glutamate receptor ionotropic, partial [Striga asiatica]
MSVISMRRKRKNVEEPLPTGGDPLAKTIYRQETIKRWKLKKLQNKSSVSVVEAVQMEINNFQDPVVNEFVNVHDESNYQRPTETIVSEVVDVGRELSRHATLEKWKIKKKKQLDTQPYVPMLQTQASAVTQHSRLENINPFVVSNLYDHLAETINKRLEEYPRMTESLVTKILIVLQQNPYEKFLKRLKDMPNLETYEIVLETLPNVDQRVFNQPQVSQVAALWVEGEDNGELGTRDIIVHSHSGHSHQISYYFGFYDPLQYPIPFPLGEKRVPIRNISRNNSTLPEQFILRPDLANNFEEMLDMEHS